MKFNKVILLAACGLTAHAAVVGTERTKRHDMDEMEMPSGMDSAEAATNDDSPATVAADETSSETISETSFVTGHMVHSQDSSEQLEPIAHEPKHHHGMPILMTELTPLERTYWEAYNTTTYFTMDAGNRGALWTHAILAFVVVFFTYPLAMMLNSVKSNWYVPALLVNLACTIVCLVSLSIFAGSFSEKLYPNNAYAKMSWILLFAILVHFVSAVIVQAARWAIGEDFDEYIPLDNFDSHSEHHDQGMPESSQSPSMTLCTEEEGERAYRHDSFDLESINLNLKKSSPSIKRDHILAKIFQHPLVQKGMHRFGTLASILFNLMNVPLFGYLIIWSVTGLAVGNLFAQGNRVFNLLAHWIKGGVFLVLGLVSLCRYMGWGAKNGFAWNKTIVLKSQASKNSLWYKISPRGMITMEFVESFLIFFYGTTNIFMEHLASPGGAWTAKDLQHASIAFMYIGCGACGLITEYKLSEWRFNHLMANTSISEEAIYAGSPGYSPNPFPAFTIFWTGILMSKHAQASETSTAIHVQWGYLLSYGSFFRLITFFLLMLVPNKNLDPSRPFTELITSFCLLCGGLIFMESTDQVVEALEYRGLTQMFTFNVSVGVVALVMAWVMILFVWKDWLLSRRNNR